MQTATRKTDFHGLATDYLNQVYANLKHNNVNLPLLIWLSAQTRLVEYHKGKQEVLPHVWLQGRAEIGKGYAMGIGRVKQRELQGPAFLPNSTFRETAERIIRAGR